MPSGVPMPSSLKKLVLAVILSVVSVGVASIATTEPAQAARCHSSRLSGHKKSDNVYLQDSDGITHGTAFWIWESAYLLDRCQVGSIAADYGVTGQYLDSLGVGWTEHVYYYNRADRKWHGLNRQYSSVQNPWHLYHDQARLYFVYSTVTRVLVVLNLYDGPPQASGSNWLKRSTLTCNPQNNSCW
jgi:hypothetical protein